MVVEAVGAKGHWERARTKTELGERAAVEVAGIAIRQERTDYLSHNLWVEREEIAAVAVADIAVAASIPPVAAVALA